MSEIRKDLDCGIYGRVIKMGILPCEDVGCCEDLGCDKCEHNPDMRRTER